jgi:hypothetical protein
MSRRALLCGFAFVLSAFAAYGREGFGFTKKAAEFNRTIPPGVSVAGTTVTVALDREHGRATSRSETLRQSVESLVLAGDRKFEAVSEGADVRVLIALDRLDSEEISKSKVEDNWVKETDSNGKTRSVNRPRTKYYTTVHANIDGNYRILDGSHHVLDSGDFDRNYDEDFDQYSSPNTDRIESNLVDWAANRIAARIVPTHQRTKVILPKGSFEEFIPYAEAGQWDKYLAAVQSVRPLNDRASDAYREFALGIASEAVASQTADPRQALELVRNAAEHYRTASANNPEERIFSERYTSIFGSASNPIERAEASVKAYEAWASGPTTPQPTMIASSKPSSSKALRNQQIIDMTRAGISDENIILLIDNAKTTEFDTTPDGLITLSKAGVSKHVIAKMQKK